MIDITKSLIGQTVSREATFRADSIDKKARSIDMAFSSETPVERWFGQEILSHDAGAVRMNRLKDGAPLLLQHDPDRQIGVIVASRIDQDKTGRATVRFSKSAAADEILQDVTDGIRSKVSVGYRVHNIILEESGDDGDKYRVTDWEPMELSIVSIPADNAVGVGRAHSTKPESMKMPEKEKDTPVADDTNIAPTETEKNARQHHDVNHTVPAPDAESQDAVRQASIDAEHDQIRQIGKFFQLGDLAEREILLGSTLANFRDLVRKHQPDPVPSVPRVEARIPHAGKMNAFRADLYDSHAQAEEAAYRAGQWARAVIFGDADAGRWCRDYGVQISKRVLTGSTGGQSVIIPDELVLPIISLREQYGLARRFCYIHPMASDTASVPRDTADVTAYFVGREAAPTQSEPGFDNINLTARNVAAETRVSNDYADDSAINLADHVAEKHARAFAVKEDSCLFNGDGTSTYGGIVGIRTAILGLAGAVDAASGNDTFAEITAVDLRGVIGALPDYPGIQPSWFTSKPGQANMFGRLKDAVGGNTKNDMSEGEAERWAGYDIVTSPAMPKVLTDLSNVAMAIFGDLRMGVIFGDRRGMTMMVDPYSLSSYQQTKIISSERFDINAHGVGDASDAGPIVALIGE